MADHTMAITTVTVRIPVGPDGGDVVLDVGRDSCTVWDNVTYTDCSTVYLFGSARPLPAPMRGGNLTEIPYFAAVFKAMSEQHARHRADPLGAFIRPAVEAMEVALATKEGACVYFAAAGDRVKIGWSRQVATRLAQLQTGCPDPIRLLRVIPGGRSVERELHRRFATARVSGEWFNMTPALLAYIESGAQPA